MLDLNRLRLLREVQRRGTLAATAAALSFSPSTVSQQLRVLEAEVGAQLLEPVGRGVRLTAAGRVLAAHADTLLEAAERARAEVAAAGAEAAAALSGQVHLAAFQTAALALVPPALAALRAAHPLLRVQVSELEPEVALPALRVRDVDVVIAEEYPGHPLPRSVEVHHSELGADELLLVVPFGLEGAGGAPAGRTAALAQLAEHPWVMEPAGTPARAWAEAVCRGAGFEPDVRFESTDVLWHARLVQTGHAAALLPELVWASTSSAAAPVRRVLSGSPHRRLFTATRRGSVEHPALRVVQQELRRALEGAQAWQASLPGPGAS